MAGQVIDIESKTEEMSKLGGVKVQMGSGKKPIKGFINIDLYEEEVENTLNVPMEQTPFSNFSIDPIYSSHSLEHLPIRRAQQAFKHWSEILNHNGRLILAVPDLEAICAHFLDADEHARSSWWEYTLFGYQVNTDVPPTNRSLDLEEDLGQFHKCGFTESKLRSMCEENNLVVDKLFKYDGYGTPSLWLEARKDIWPTSKKN